jgi:hypothetical protein
MTDDKKREKESHPIIPDNAKAVCMACGKKFLVGNGPHVCPDPIRAAAEEMHDTTGGVLRIEYFERILRAQVERETRECAKMALRYSKPLEQMMLDRIRRQGGE